MYLHETGQGMVGYALLAALVVIVVIVLGWLIAQGVMATCQFKALAGALGH